MAKLRSRAATATAPAAPPAAARKRQSSALNSRSSSPAPAGPRRAGSAAVGVTSESEGDVDDATRLSQEAPNRWRAFPAFLRQYESVRVLGQGEYGQVVMVRRRRTGQEFALKIITQMDDEGQTEIDVLMRVSAQHRNVCCYYDRFTLTHEVVAQVVASAAGGRSASRAGRPEPESSEPPMSPQNIRTRQRLQRGLVAAADGRDLFRASSSSSAAAAAAAAAAAGRSSPVAPVPVAPTYCIMTELVRGRSLDQFIGRREYVADDLTLYVLLESGLSALSFLHEKMHVAHRDIKPANLMVADTTDRGLVVIDFGLATFLDPGCDVPAESVGTPNFMCPSLIRAVNEEIPYDRELWFAADVWGLGASLFYLCTGRELARYHEDWDESFDEVLAFRTPRVIYGGDPALNAILHDMMESDYHLRPVASVLLDRLHALPRPVPITGRHTRSAQRRQIPGDGDDESSSSSSDDDDSASSGDETSPLCSDAEDDEDDGVSEESSESDPELSAIRTRRQPRRRRTSRRTPTNGRAPAKAKTKEIVPRRSRRLAELTESQQEDEETRDSEDGEEEEEEEEEEESDNDQVVKRSGRGRANGEESSGSEHGQDEDDSSESGSQMLGKRRRGGPANGSSAGQTNGGGKRARTVTEPLDETTTATRSLRSRTRSAASTGPGLSVAADSGRTVAPAGRGRRLRSAGSAPVAAPAGRRIDNEEEEEEEEEEEKDVHEGEKEGRQDGSRYATTAGGVAANNHPNGGAAAATKSVVLLADGPGGGSGRQLSSPPGNEDDADNNAADRTAGRGRARSATAVVATTPNAPLAQPSSGVRRRRSDESPGPSPRRLRRRVPTKPYMPLLRKGHDPSRPDDSVLSGALMFVQRFFGIMSPTSASPPGPRESRPAVPALRARQAPPADDGARPRHRSRHFLTSSPAGLR